MKAPTPFPLWRSLLFVALAATTLAFCILTRPPTATTTAGVRLELPYQIGDWWGIDQEISLTEKTLLPSDTEFARKNYESSHGDQVMCSIVLSGAEKRSIHRPEICLPGQGWTIHESQVVSVPLHSGHILPVMCLTLSRPVTLPSGHRKEIYSYYIYWFVGDHVVTPYHWRRIWLSSWDRVVHHVNHRWAYVIVNSMITEDLRTDGKTPAQTLAMLKTFIAEIVPRFQLDEGASPLQP